MAKKRAIVARAKAAENHLWYLALLLTGALSLTLLVAGDLLLRNP